MMEHETPFIGGPRYLHKTWQDSRPGWKRRIRWYDSQRTFKPIRLELIDEYGRVNVYPDSRDIADTTWKLFIDGGMDTRRLLKEVQ